MITLFLLLMLLLTAIIFLLVSIGATTISFGWLLLIVGDVALAVWVIVKIIKKICKKKD